MFTARLLLAFTIGAVSSSHVGIACSCADLKPLAADVAQSDAVFTGEVVAIRIAPRWWQDSPEPVSSDLIQEGSRVEEVTFAVDRAWKGVSTQQLLIITPFEIGLCGYEFQVGQQYLVFASYEEGRPRLSTGACRRIIVVRGTSDVPDALGAPLVDYQTARHRRMLKRSGVPHADDAVLPKGR